MRKIAVIILLSMLAALALHAETQPLSPSFVAYIKACEGWRLEPYIDSTGHATIGYGHMIKSGEHFGRLTKDEGTALLMDDLNETVLRVRRHYKQTLSQKQIEMFVDFYFNLGSMKAFPKMERAILSNDMDGMRREYKRYAGGRELTWRNIRFKERFL